MFSLYNYIITCVEHRFDQVMELMQEMQTLGHPPQELVGDGSSSTPSFPVAEGIDPNQCPMQ